jgi:hypothetical protein
MKWSTRKDLTFTFAFNQNNSNLGGYFPIQAHFYLRPLSILQYLLRFILYFTYYYTYKNIDMFYLFMRCQDETGDNSCFIILNIR